MSISENIQNEIKEAMRSKNAARLSALRMIRAALIEEAKAGSGEVTDERTIATITRVKKMRLDSAETYRAAGRPDLAEGETAEAAICDEFLPRLADEATVSAWVREAITAAGATSLKELGKVMGALSRAHKGEFDNTMARQKIEQELKALGA